ncbi:MAG: hypothetical protein AAF250_16265 [Pseudomonadota bacterium]
MDKLPELLPDDLRHRLETVMGFRYHGAADLYAAFREWFEQQNVVRPIDGEGPQSDPLRPPELGGRSP